jgi:hypothetical protein
MVTTYIYQLAMNTPYGHKMNHVGTRLTNWPKNIPKFIILKTSKLYHNWDVLYKIYHLATLV